MYVLSNTIYEKTQAMFMALFTIYPQKTYDYVTPCILPTVCVEHICKYSQYNV